MNSPGSPPAAALVSLAAHRRLHPAGGVGAAVRDPAGTACGAGVQGAHCEYVTHGGCGRHDLHE